jgi:hypothetical protein
MRRGDKAFFFLFPKVTEPVEVPVSFSFLSQKKEKEMEKVTPFSFYITCNEKSCAPTGLCLLNTSNRPMAQPWAIIYQPFRLKIYSY